MAEDREAHRPELMLGRTFLAQLVGDVIDSSLQLKARPSDTARRHLVRTIFAAIEGVIWTCREHVLSISRSLETLTPLADLALREQTYSVSERGEVIEQIRFVTLPAMVRLVARQAQLIEPDLQVDFGHRGWQSLKLAIAIRNRITHPKLKSDLQITDADLTDVANGFSWILATSEYIMASTIEAQRWQTLQMRDILDRLKSGDPVALEEYRLAVAEVRDQE